MGIFEYILANHLQILNLLIEHIKLTALSVGLAIIIGVPLGIFISYSKKSSKPILSVANIVQAIPSMALLGFMIPLLGIGSVPAIVAVVLYSLLPIIKNTYTGIESISPETLEAAKGIGLTPSQVLFKIQIPLALPIIMAGVRIASVTAVGLMTMAAFIGAGGLGYLVFSGIRTVNTSQILAGAIPACFLALFVDFIFSVVEKLVTPISLQKGDNTLKKKNRNRQKGILATVSLLLVFLFIGTSFSGVENARTISIGSKDFTEQAILGNMISDLIEDRTDIEVNRKLEIGGTQICFGAIQTGDIDMYVEYSGTAYSDMLKYPTNSDMSSVYNTVKSEFKEKYDLEVLEQMNINNTFTLAVTQETAEKYKLETISDFAKVANTLTSGTGFEFINREDGLKGLEKLYGFKMKESLALDGAPRYLALINQEVDVIDGFATDGLLKKFNLKTLIDDKNFFPPYFAIPIIKADSLEKFPEIPALLQELGAVLNDEVMIDLNYQVDELQRRPKDVAKEFLQLQGLIS